MATAINSVALPGATKSAEDSKGLLVLPSPNMAIRAKWQLLPQAEAPSDPSHHRRRLQGAGDPLPQSSHSKRLIGAEAERQVSADVRRRIRLLGGFPPRRGAGV